MAEIIWSKFAIEDLKNIYDFIAKDSSFYAKRHINKLSERVSQLLMFPNSGRIVPEFNKTSIRELIEGNYRIVYNINGKKLKLSEFIIPQNQLILIKKLIHKNQD